MEGSFDVPDPSDWLKTPVSSLGPVETALRCQVCKDFFVNPVVTSCSHTFCSLCIRRCLTNDGKCPTCRAVDQELRLRPNWVVEELVDAFQTARPDILQLGRDLVALKEDGAKGHKKRKLEITDSDESEVHVQSTGQERVTRSQKKVERVPDANEDISIYEGLIACPICAKRMKEEEVFSHLDVHNETPDRGEMGGKNAVMRDPGRVVEQTFTSRIQPKAPMDRLPQLNYSLLNDNAMRKKISGLGLPTNGPRGLLMRRHTEWVNLVNSNCDSRKPKSKRELLYELEVWERSQGRQIVTNGSMGSSVMDKDFDGTNWASKHSSDFQRLISEARKKARPETVAEDNVAETSTTVIGQKREVSDPLSRENKDIEPAKLR